MLGMCVDIFERVIFLQVSPINIFPTPIWADLNSQLSLAAACRYAHSHHLPTHRPPANPSCQLLEPISKYAGGISSPLIFSVVKSFLPCYLPKWWPISFLCTDWDCTKVLLSPPHCLFLCLPPGPSWISALRKSGALALSSIVHHRHCLWLPCTSALSPGPGLLELIYSLNGVDMKYWACLNLGIHSSLMISHGRRRNTILISQ